MRLMMHGITRVATSDSYGGKARVSVWKNCLYINLQHLFKPHEVSVFHRGVKGFVSGVSRCD